MKANFRQLFVYNMDVTTAKSDARLPSMSELIDVWERRRQAGSAHVAVQNGDIDLTLGDVVIDRQHQYASLLIRLSDKHSANPVHSNPRAGIFRAHAKQTGEGGEIGAHIFVSLAQERGLPNRYTSLVEKVAGLDITLIRRVLNRLLRDEYDSNTGFYSYPHPGGQRTRAGAVAMVRCLPRVEFGGRPSATLASDVQNGRLTGIELTKAVTHVPVGGVPYITKKEATLKLEIDQHGLGGNIWGDVRRALRAESADYQSATIGLRLPGRSKTVSVKVATRDGSPLSDLYIRSFDLAQISPPMDQSAQAVVTQLAQRALPLLVQERTL